MIYDHFRSNNVLVEHFSVQWFTMLFTNINLDDKYHIIILQIWDIIIGKKYIKYT